MEEGLALISLWWCQGVYAGACKQRCSMGHDQVEGELILPHAWGTGGGGGGGGIGASGGGRLLLPLAWGHRGAWGCFCHKREQPKGGGASGGGGGGSSAFATGMGPPKGHGAAFAASVGPPVGHVGGGGEGRRGEQGVE